MYAKYNTCCFHDNILYICIHAVSMICEFPTKEKKHTTKQKTYNKAGTGVTNLYNKYSEQISKQDGTDLHKDFWTDSMEETRVERWGSQTEEQ